jgi:hypothetical protein
MRERVTAMSAITITHVDDIEPRKKDGIELRTLTPSGIWP